jgi:branched-chain amino acid transport system permease protein
MSQLLTAVLGGLGIGSVFALVALGFSFIFKTTSSFNFAQGQIVPVGSLLTYSAYTVAGLPAAIAVILVAIVTAIIGALIERVGVYPLSRRGDNDPLLWIMTTLGLSAIITGIALRIWGGDPLGVDNYIGERVTRFGESYIATPYIIAFFGSIAVTVGIWLFQSRTRWGRTMRAIADNRIAVQLAGVNTLTYGLVAYAIGAALAGIGGFLIAPITYASATGGFIFTIMGFAALSMGGFTSLIGALVGGWMVGLIQTLVGTFFGLQYSDFSVFIALLLVLMIKPDGLFVFGKARKV